LKGSYSTTFQTFFRKYTKMAGMTGPASSAAFEFLNVYRQCIVPIPPNKPVRRFLYPDRVFRSPKSKYLALMGKIESVHATGRPVLIGTGSVQISERISEMLTERKLAHDVLNAKNHAREAEIIARAGEEGRITVITNMAGRGVDILLGKGVADRGGMCLLGTDRLAFRRLDDQLTGRVGRQGDPGDCEFYLSLKDDLLRHAGRKTIHRLRKKTRVQRNLPIPYLSAAKLFSKTQNHIARVARKQRKRVFLAEKQREKLKEQGLWESWMDSR